MTESAWATKINADHRQVDDDGGRPDDFCGRVPHDHAVAAEVIAGGGAINHLARDVQLVGRFLRCRRWLGLPDH